MDNPAPQDGGLVLEKEKLRRKKYIAEFRTSQQSTWRVIDSHAGSVLLAIRHARKQVDADRRAASALMLWHTLWNYQLDAAILLITRYTDIGNAVLRMAAELAKDCAKIGESESNYQLWTERNKRREEYKSTFCFDSAAKNRNEEAVRNLFDYGSSFGVHCHQTRDMTLQSNGPVPGHDDFTLLAPSPERILGTLDVWLTTALPLHMYCFNSFPRTFQLAIRDEMSLFVHSADLITQLVIEKREPRVDAIFPTVLDRELQRRNQFIADFQQNQPEVWSLADSLAGTFLLPITHSQLCPGLDVREIILTMLWHTLWDYQVEAFFLFISSRIDQGYAALRLAAELARDLARVAESEHNYDLWTDRLRKHASEEYRRIFRFNDKNNKLEKMARDVYNKGTNYGVRSQLSVEYYLEISAEAQDLVVLNPSEIQVYEGLELWLSSFASLQMCCIQQLPQKLKTHLSDLLNHVAEIAVAAEPCITQVQSGLKTLKAEERNTSSATSKQ